MTDRSRFKTRDAYRKQLHAAQDPKGFNASAFQVLCAYHFPFWRDIDVSKPYASSSQEIVASIFF